MEPPENGWKRRLYGKENYGKKNGSFAFLFFFNCILHSDRAVLRVKPADGRSMHGGGGLCGLPMSAGVL